jgi:23S rRNA (guanosine2251-2'-O)-methyltransferase
VNQYSEAKFQELSMDRKIRVMLDLIYKIEESWDEAEVRKSGLKLFTNYFEWINLYESKDPLLSKISHLQFQIEEQMSLRSLLDIAVPLERHLNVSVKEEQLFNIDEGDVLVSRSTFPLYFVLDHLRSAFNVGSLFRTAECLGVEHIYLVGYTPTPDDKGVQKTAMGTDKIVSWSQHNHIDEVFSALAKLQVPVVALETAKESQSLMNFQVKDKIAILVGNERFGLSPQTLEKVETVVSLPMMGGKNSLNVANTLSIATFEMVRQWQK